MYTVCTYMLLNDKVAYFALFFFHHFLLSSIWKSQHHWPKTFRISSHLLCGNTCLNKFPFTMWHVFFFAKPPLKAPWHRRLPCCDHRKLHCWQISRGCAPKIHAAATASICLCGAPNKVAIISVQTSCWVPAEPGQPISTTAWSEIQRFRSQTRDELTSL